MCGAGWRMKLHYRLHTALDRPEATSPVCSSIGEVASRDGCDGCVKGETHSSHSRQNTWEKVVDGLISAGSLDRFYMSSLCSNRLLSNNIHPGAFTDHYLVTFDLYISPTTQTVKRRHVTQWHGQSHIETKETEAK